MIKSAKVEVEVEAGSNKVLLVHKNKRRVDICRDKYNHKHKSINQDKNQLKNKI